jgi:quercetin dioxygenase-like cupin family protein
VTNRTEWRTGWDAEHPVRIHTKFTGRDEGDWAAGLRRGVQYRDLGLAEATDGHLGAQHIRLTPEAPSEADWHFHDLDFQWFYVLNGTITIRGEDGREVTLTRGDSGYQPGFWRHREFDASSDYEAVEVTAPATAQTVTGEHAPKPERAAQFAHLSAIYTHDVPENYVRGTGPRSYLLYRDLQTREATDGRIHMHVLRIPGEEAPSTGAHRHTMAQFFMPLRGWIDLIAEGEPERRCYPGDFYMIDSGAVHNALRASTDYETLEMCVPAEYDTVPVS